MRLDEDDSLEAPAFRPKPATGPWLLAVGACGVAGAMFAGVSTADFISHLDRQVHSIHCSIIPGAGAQLGESGCRTVMMSPYSSMFRESIWGGIPISLLAFAVFAYLAFRGIDFGLRRDVTKRHTGFMVAATGLPVLMSTIYGYISLTQLDALCNVCAGIYATSALAFVFAILAHTKATPAPLHESPGPLFGRWFFEGVGYVAVLLVLYVTLAPVSDKSKEGCGRLVKTTDKAGVLIPFSKSRGGKPGIAVLDPLCPACRAFDGRMEASGLFERLNLKVLMFPLDSKCNWMVKESLHPGACAVSEAILCDKDRAREIVDWAFANQEDLLDQGKNDEKGLRRRITQQFPSVRGCLGRPKVKNKLNKSLRWAVANALPVLTPQLFLGDRRICDEDTDLGLEYAVATMLGR